MTIAYKVAPLAARAFALEYQNLIRNRPKSLAPHQ